MRVLLDTQAFIQAIMKDAASTLPNRVKRILLDPENRRELSVISLSEIALKTSKRKLDLSSAQIRTGIRDLIVDLVPVRPEYVWNLFTLPLHHSDPNDRLLIAHALTEDIPIVSGDREFKNYRGLKVIW